MRLMENKISSIVILMICFFSFACGQTQAEKIKLHNEYADKATTSNEQGETEKAIEYQQKAVDLFPDNADSLSVLAGFHIDLYEKNKSKEKLKKAKIFLEKATKIKPKDVVKREMLSTTLELLGDKKGALREMKIAVELEPDNLDNRVNLAVIQKSLGDDKSARSNLDKVLETNPNYIYALYHYGEIELEDGNTEKAREYFEKAIGFEKSAEQRDLRYIKDSKEGLNKIENGKVKAANK